MKIGTKINVGLVIIYAGIVAGATFFTIQVRNEMKSYIGASLVSLAVETSDKIDRDIFGLIESLKSTVRASPSIAKEIERSNDTLAAMGSGAAINDYIKTREREWVSAGSDETAPFVQEVLDNEASRSLKNLADYFQRRRGFDVFEDISVTNKYGLTVAQTVKAGDYRQDIKDWWAEAKSEGIYISDIQYDERSRTHCIIAAFAMKDKTGNFTGAVKTAINLQEVYNIIEAVKNGLSYQNSFIELVDSNGRRWYGVDSSMNFGRAVPDNSTADIVKTAKSGFLIEREAGGNKILFRAFGRSRGFKEYKELGWSVIINVDTSEVFRPLAGLTLKMAIALISTLLVIFFIGRAIAFTVIRPLKRLQKGAEMISAGNMNYKVEIFSKDEIGVLSKAFDDMIARLRAATVSRDELADEVIERKRVERELKDAYNKVGEAHAQLVQAAKMASLGTLAGGVAHEINNPLTGILNNIQLVKIAIDQHKPFEQSDYKEILDAIEASALRCMKITQSLLRFSRISKGEFKPVSLNESVDEVLGLIGHEISLEKIAINNDLERGMPEVLGESQLLQQVIFDMIANARWAINKRPGGAAGVIDIKTSYDKERDRVILSISDTGIGIPKENLDKIFEPFFTTKPVGDGTGLGLSISYGIIKQHGGVIEAESKDGRGATFRIILPALKKNA